jgi:dTDP-4-amino-4,6-dideoxygalactose transaminase
MNLDIKMNYRLSQPEISEEEIAAVTEVLRSEFFGMGREVASFEEKLGSFFGRETLCVSTGTAAVQLGLIGAGIKPGDEVLVPSLTFIATYQAISATGAIPVSCDVDPNSLQIDLDDARKRITPKTKAIVPVYFVGATNCLDLVAEFGIANNLRVVADAAHAFGSKHKGNLVGSFGDISCFSFDGIKNITSGEGGCIVTDDQDALNRIRDARLLGVVGDSEKRKNRLRSWDFDVQHQGWRFHMSDIFAAIGMVQLAKLEVNSKKRQELFNRYLLNFKDNSRISLFEWDTSAGMVPHIFVLRVPGLRNRDDLRLRLENLGIPTGVHYKPNHLLSFYKEKYRLPATELIYPEILTLPLHTRLTPTDVDKICEIFNEVITEVY